MLLSAGALIVMPIATNLTAFVWLLKIMLAAISVERNSVVVRVHVHTLKVLTTIMPVCV